MKEIHVIGPPGTGKTTWLSRQVELAADKYGADRVMVTSFTKAAVAELNRRNLPIPKEQIGTLHAMAFHALDRPKIAETGALLKDFSTAHPSFEITDATRDGIEDGYTQAGKNEGSKLLQEYSRLRALMRPREFWPARIADFAQTWEAFKNDIHARDFTDLIEDCVKEELSPGYEAAVWFFDEVQDFTPLELALMRQWGRNLEKIVLVGDADQCIYSFKGAQADLGLNPDAHLMTLKHSYRVSQAVHEFSERIINLIPREDRLQREYLPTAETGEVFNLNGTYQRPETWFESVQKHLDQFQTVMILASCSYMVAPVVEFLRRQGIPFANPYRRKRRDWNPLVHSKKTITAAMRVQSYLAGWRRDPVTWTGLELGRWLPLGSRIVKRGGKEKITEQVGADTLAPMDLIQEVLPVAEMLTEGPGWILDRLAAAHRRVDYHLRVGLKAWEDIETKPALMVGTIHSVKGGEADCSPPDEPILTTNRGYVPIGELNPDYDYLVSFNSDHHKIHRGGPRRPKGYQFTKASRPYEGRLMTIKTENSLTQVTPNHLMTVRWALSSLDIHVVYLMKKGNWWRIGISKIHTQSGKKESLQNRVAGRMRQQKADMMWIIGVFKTKRDALYYESLWSNKYQVPDLAFENNKSQDEHLLTDDLHKIWNQIKSEKGALRLLKDKNLSHKWPLFDRRLFAKENNLAGTRYRQTGLRNRWVIRAINLLPGFMEIPTDPGSGQEPLWLPFTVDESYYKGLVYSLDVERWHHYISGGAIVHNCVVLFPDLSPEAARAVRFGEIGPTARMMFVGATRARTSLYLGQATNFEFALRWP